MTGRVSILGLPLDPVDRGGLLDAVERMVADGGRHTVAYLNVHVANTAARSADLAAFLGRADLVYCDGEGIRLGARVLGRVLPERITGADWIWDLAARAEGRWRLFWLGGEPGVTERAALRLRERHPGLELATDHGFHPPDEQRGLVARINGWAPDILLVGMGTPLQERWVGRWRPEIRAPVAWVLGATADFVSGKVPRGPELLYRRQEWVARLLADPRRLWRRYLVGNAVFLGRVLAARAGARFRAEG